MRNFRALLAATCSLLGASVLPSPAQSPGSSHLFLPSTTIRPAVSLKLAPQVMQLSAPGSTNGMSRTPSGSGHTGSNQFGHTWFHPARTGNQPSGKGPNSTANSTTVSAATTSSGQTNLDLSSTSTSATAGSLLGNRSVSIDVGGTTVSVNSSTPLTPAEMLAVYQVNLTGKQSLILGANGTAVGGTVILSANVAKNLGTLVIPKAVTVIDISKAGDLDVTGSLTDDGTLYIAGRSGTANIEAGSISVQQGGTISDTLPKSLAGGLGSSQALDLSTKSDIDNSGTISSSGNVTLNPGSGNVTNTGMISSSNGSINITTPQNSTDINVSANGGTFQAINGAINVRDSSYTGSANVNLNGGNYLSTAMNVYSGTGTVNNNVGNISGVLGIAGGAAHTTVSSANLQLGTLALAGDPTFYNSAGNITLGGNISVGQALSLVASGNILSNGNYSITANNGSSGFQINLIAGANITAPSGGSSTIVGGGAGTVASGSIDVTGASTTGGNVTFSGHNMTISSAASSGNNSGGDVNVVAFANTAGNGGRVLLSPGTSIGTGGSGTGVNGNVSILAGSPSAVAIATGSINTAGGTGGGGDVTIQTAQPQTSPSSVTINPNGSLAVGNKFVASGTTNSASIVVNAPITSAGNVTLTSQGVAIGSTVSATTASKDITIQSPGNLTVAGRGSLTTTASGETELLAKSAGSTLTVAGGTNLSINGGGQVDIRTPNLTFAGPRSAINATGKSNIFVDAGDSAANVDLTVSSSGAATLSTNGGTIDMSPTGIGNANFVATGNHPTVLNLNAAGTNGNGLVDVHGLGNITINKGVTLSTNSPIQFNMNSGARQQTFTLNGVLTSSAAPSDFPDPLGGSMLYSILIQNLFTDFNVAGTGLILQTGTTPGNTVFNDFTNVNFLSGTKLTTASIHPGSYTNFYTRQITVAGTGAASATLNAINVNAVNFNSNLPSPAPGDVAFLGSPGATSATFHINGAPVNVGFPGSPPVSIPALQQPVGNITVGKNFTLIAHNPISLYATNSVNILGSIINTSGNGRLIVQSPQGDNLNIGGGGTLRARGIALTSPSNNINFGGNISLLGASLLSALSGKVNILPGQTVSHVGPVIINSPGSIPSGFNPTQGVVIAPRTLPVPSAGGVKIVAPNVNVSGNVTAAF